MNDTNISTEISDFILAQAPVLLASLGGLLVALRFRRRAPAASLWAAGAFALALFTSALVGVGQAVGSDATTHFIGPVLRGTTYVLLLIGVYAGRTDLSAAPADAPAESIWRNVKSTIRARPGLLGIFFTMFFGVFLLVVITTTLVTFILPESFVSQARIELRPTAPNARGPLPGAAVGFDPGLIKTECEVIRSEVILGKAVEDLDLNREWGKKYADGERLKTSESLALLRGRLDVRPLPDTSIIEIRVYDERPDEAAKVANAIAEAYRAHLAAPASAASTSGEAQAEMAGTLARESTTGSATSLAFGPRLEILDRAVPGFRPVRPNKPLNIALGVLIGLALGLLAGASACWVGFQFGKKPVANPRN